MDQPPKRFLNFSLEHLRESRQGIWFALDMAMLLLLVLNLTLLVLDSLYLVDFIRSFIDNNLGPGADAFAWLHRNFLLIDLVFVSIFLSEFALRWWVAVRDKTYHRWFFYPFIHWYDLLGCIPLGSFRLLRFLRVISIIYRLHKYRIIDVRQTAVYRFITFYYDVFLEELSDRVVIKVINGVQDDLGSGSDMGQRVLDQLVMPRMSRLESLVRGVSGRLSQDMKQDENHPFAETLRESVIAAMQGNEELKRLADMPFLGNRINRHVEELVADVVVDTLATLVGQSHILLQPETLKALTDRDDQSWQALDQEVLALLHDILELVKEQVGQKAWKQKLDALNPPEDRQPL